jgi:hypothetical protein
MRVAPQIALFLGALTASGFQPPLFAVGLTATLIYAEVVTSARPLADASLLLQEMYGQAVTYEEAMPVWNGELRPEPRSTSERQYLFPKLRSFSMPAEAGSDRDLSSVLNKTLAAYHEQTDGPRFGILKSALGFHIVPVQAFDQNGSLKSTKSVLDTTISIPSQVRTASGHLHAIGDSVSMASGTHVEVSAVSGRPNGFDVAFGAEPDKFSWGADSIGGRDALIDLLSRSATTYSWRLKCQASAIVSERMCVLNVGMLEVTVQSPDGKTGKRVLGFDRCGKCPLIQPHQ